MIIMKENKYTKFIDKVDTNEEFKKELIKKIKEEELKKGVIKMKIKNKITAIIASLGILTCSGIAYATFVPEEIKNTINNKISNFFGIEISHEETVEYNVGVQEETFNEIVESDKENIDNYTELTDPTLYGIGDANGGALIETNYKQYDWNLEYDEEGNPVEKTLEKYENIINIKLGRVNYTCLEKFNKEVTLEEFLKYQDNEFKTNWNYYYHDQEEFNEELNFKITGMLVMNGNNISEEDYYNNARAKKVKIIFDEKEEKIIELEDKKEAQFIDLEYVHNDISKPVDITIEVLETYDGELNNDIYIADIQFGISSNIPAGR